MEQSRHGEGVTSVKVHHQPGGASSFSLAHDDGSTDDRWGNNNKIGHSAPVQQQTSAVLQSEQARANAPEAGPGAFTSVRFSGNPPGGKSSITF